MRGLRGVSLILGMTAVAAFGADQFDPGRWNQEPITRSTNCYTYAANDPDGHPPGKPQPGQHCGKPPKSISCAEVSRAAICDGMLPASDPRTVKPGHYPVALVVDPDVDFHWYRLDDNGLWSHKTGHGDVTNVDASGRPVANPEKADRIYADHIYSDFCGYFYVPAGGIRTGPSFDVPVAASNADLGRTLANVRNAEPGR